MLLGHLRDERRLRGTKEGCAEGDCGACMVVIAELTSDDETSVVYRAVNSCILPLPAITNRLVLTVEDLDDGENGLHPVQKALVECHGSQCGFCTPGFVMSLYALYLNHDVYPGRASVNEALSGNLCRCTGYLPILEAAERMYAYPRCARDPEVDAARLRDMQQKTAVQKPQAAYDTAAQPKTIAEVCEILSKDNDARIVAGATDLALEVTKDLKSWSRTVHLDDVRELQEITQTAQGLSIGTSCVLSEVFPLMTKTYPELSDYFYRFASLSIRNRATLGGNIANGSPIGDSMPVLLALDADLEIASTAGRRVIALSDFYLGYRKLALKPAELLARILVPPRPEDLFLRAYKISKRREDDISAVAMVIALTLKDGIVESARIAFGGLAEMPRRAKGAETILEGQAFGRETVNEAVASIEREFSPISDHRASASYRLRVAGNLLRRALAEFEGTPITQTTQLNCEVAL